MLVLLSAVGMLFALLGLFWAIDKGRASWQLAFMLVLVVAAVTFSLAVTK